MKEDFINVKLIKVKEENIEMTLAMLFAHVRQEAIFGRPVYYEDPVGRTFKIEEVRLDEEAE